MQILGRVGIEIRNKLIYIQIILSNAIFIIHHRAIEYQSLTYLIK